MSDAPMDSVESVDSANVTDLAPENDTSLSPGDDSEQQVKLVSASQPVLSTQHPLLSPPPCPNHHHHHSSHPYHHFQYHLNPFYIGICELGGVKTLK